MREIEVLLELKDDIDSVKTKLLNFNFEGSKRTIDRYYFDPLRSSLQFKNGKLLECFRVRQKAGEYFLTYKIDHYEGLVWKYSDEHETKVFSLEAIEQIVKRLGLVELVTIDSTKHIFTSHRYEIVLEEVHNLGSFLEVELLSDDLEIEVDQVKKEIREFIESLSINIGGELNSGKPELLLRKRFAIDMPDKSK